MSNISAIRNMLKDAARINAGKVPLYVSEIMSGAFSTDGLTAPDITMEIV
jgi:hypothetical protein